jgi:RNA polymerase sigma factor (sigma-70 family)
MSNARADQDAASAEDDRALARRAAGGDRTAFELVMRRHNRRLYRLARASLRDDAEAEDAVQEAYLSAFRSIGQFRGEASLCTWLSRLVLNECLNRARRQARRDNIVLTVPPSSDSELDTMRASPADPPDKGKRVTEALWKPNHCMSTIADRARQGMVCT